MSGRWCAYLLMFWFATVGPPASGRMSEAADFLGDLDDVAAYWEIPLEEPAEDPMAVPRALGLIARSQNMSELARRVGVSRDGLKRPRPPASPPVPSHSPPPSDPTTSAPTSADH